MELIHVLYLLIAFIILRQWWKTYQARELAEKMAKRICQKENVQLLDGTVAFNKINIKKNSWLDIQLIRFFKFEFTINGVDRRTGIIALNQYQKQEYVFLDLPESPTIDV